MVSFRLNADVITLSRMDRLPNFLSCGAPLARASRAELRCNLLQTRYRQDVARILFSLFCRNENWVRLNIHLNSKSATHELVCLKFSNLLPDRSSKKLSVYFPTSNAKNWSSLTSSAYSNTNKNKSTCKRL